MPRVLVVGDFPQSLAIVRSLGRAGYKVVLVYQQHITIAGRSRYCENAWRSPPLESAAFAEQFVDYLGSLEDVVALFPVGVRAIVRIHELAAQQGSQLPVVAVEAALARVFDDKPMANSVVSAAGVAVPESRIASGLDELRQITAEMAYPLIVKSPDNAGPVMGRKALLLWTADEFSQAFTQWPQEHRRLMVQRYISGVHLACDFLAWQGRIVAYYEGCADVTDERDGTGFVVDFTAQPPSPELFECLQKIVGHVNYSGPGLLQCIRCEQTNVCYFVELNPRLSAGVQEVIHGGLDLPTMALECVLGTPPPALQAPQDAVYRVHSHTYWFERDFRGYRRQRHEMGFMQQLRWWLQAAGRWWRCDGHINLDWKDPMPSIAILTTSIRQHDQPGNG